MSADDPYRSAADTWLSLVDQGRYAQSWTAASDYFRSTVTEAAWQQTVNAARAPLGALKNRNLQGETASTSLPGAPDGRYEVLRYQSVFANKAAAVETLTLMREGEAWKAAGYFIK